MDDVGDRQQILLVCVVQLQVQVQVAHSWEAAALKKV
jgi:hypothetical protein